MRRLAAFVRRAAVALTVLAGCRSGNRSDWHEARALVDQMVPGRIARPGLAYDLVYRLYVPPSYDSSHSSHSSHSSRRYPLLVFLHGSGALGDDNRRHIGPELARLHARLQAQEPVFVLAPQCPAGNKWVTGAHTAPHYNFSQAERPESDALKLVLFLLDELERKYALDPDRIYVTGHSSGAAGTWDIVSRRAHDRFAAAVPVTGVGDPARAFTMVRLPIWAFHGAKDETSPPQNSRHMVAALRALGSSVRYTEYADLGHDTLARAYREPELVPWLLGQRRVRPLNPLD